MNISGIQSRALTRSDIGDAEQKYGIIFPNDYVQFLLRNNGGIPDKTKFITEDKKVESHVKFFMPFDDGMEENVLEELESITIAGWLPSNLIPIAITPAGNRVVISIDGSDRGSVFFWAWDEQDEDDPPTYRFVRRISPNFIDFLNSLS